MEEPYYADFVLAYMYRESCYRCRFACKQRPGDITLGDFWGVEHQHSDFEIDSSNGVSCVLINTDKGLRAFEKIQDQLFYMKSCFEKVAAGNSSLLRPADRPDIREIYYSKIRTKGFQWSKSQLFKRKSFYISWIKRHIPKPIKQKLKRVKRKLS